MNGRVYDPALGRFLSVDPVFAFPTNMQSLNPYSYVLNNPLSLTDPSGYTPKCNVGTTGKCSNGYTGSSRTKAGKKQANEQKLGALARKITSFLKAAGKALSDGEKALLNFVHDDILNNGGKDLQAENGVKKGQAINDDENKAADAPAIDNPSAISRGSTAGTFDQEKQKSDEDEPPMEGVESSCPECSILVGLKAVGLLKLIGPAIIGMLKQPKIEVPKDIGNTLARIRNGETLKQFRNDGSVFSNDEGRLPDKPEGYYREYVHPTPGVPHAGLQRIVTGRGGEVYYTPDHYEHFVPIKTDSPP